MRNDDLHRALRTGTLEPNISKTVRDRGLVTMEHQWEMAYGESNGHVTLQVLNNYAGFAHKRAWWRSHEKNRKLTCRYRPTCVCMRQCDCITVSYNTRKLCYRKDDRAMRHIHGCPENFRDSLTTPTATIPNSFHGLLFGLTLWMLLQNLKSVALSVPQIIGGTPKIWTVPGYALAPVSPKFLIGFYSDWPYKCTRQICSP